LSIFSCCWGGFTKIITGFVALSDRHGGVRGIKLQILESCGAISALTLQDLDATAVGR